MATTNLISKSLGDILTESGNGVPDHTSPIGSLYSDKDSGLLYQNSNGGTSWLPLQSVAYGTGVFQDNTSATTITTLDVWEPSTGDFTEGTNVGISANTNTLVIESGYGGKYEVRGDVTLSYVGGTNNYEAGLSVNGADPVAGTYGGCLLDVTYTRQHVGFQTIVDLADGDTLSIDVKNVPATDNIIVRHAQLFARKVG